MEYYLQDKDGSGLHGRQTSHQTVQLGEKLEWALTCHKSGRLEPARQAYLQILQQQPEHYDANRMLGLIAQTEGDLALAAKHISTAVLSASHLPLAYQDLGNVLFAAGRLEDASVCYRDALNIDANLAESHVGMANVLNRQGQDSKAMQACSRALTLQPECPQAYYFLGSYHQQRHRLKEAEQAYRKAIALRPNSMGHSNLGILYMEQGCIEKAEAAFKRAIRMDPKNRLAYTNLTNLLWDLNRSSEAVSLMTKAIRRIPGDTALLSDYAGLLISLNDLSQVEELCRQALALDPACVNAYLQLAKLGIEQFSVDDLLRLTALADDEEIAVDQKVRIHFTLASSHRDIGDCQQEFHHLQIGNRLQKESQDYSLSEEIDSIKRIGRSFNQKFIEQRTQFGLHTSAPLFIVGMPRSGTTLTEQILASHPDIYGGGEQRHLNDLISQFAMQHRSHGMEGFLHHLALISHEDFSSAGRRYLKLTGADRRAERSLTDKMPANFKNIGLIHLMFPDAKIIHCTRHPVATCFSCYSSLFNASQGFAYDLEDLGLYYLAYRELMDHWQNLLPGKIHEVNYEKLVTDQEQETRSLLDFCQLEWQQSCLSFHENKRAVLTASHAQVSQPIYSSSLHRWKRYEDGLQPLIQLLKTRIDI